MMVQQRLDNAELSADGLSGLGLGDIDPDKVQQLNSVDAMPGLQRVGKAVVRQVDADHYAGFLGSVGS